ncbi:MAG: 1-acyl-sn-glycerol-3-phosphate acyltransferase [Lachnospiraceae bacterium]|nr:1-acyl-sn-glycerol-3-phosphate acyltransferase [Lachnospiraceae bacterium]
MVRTVLVLLYICVMSIVTLPFLILFLLLKLVSKKAASKLGQPFAKYVCFWPIFLLSGGRITIEGRENIPKDTAVLFAGNHRSMYDIFAGYITIPASHSTSFIAKYEMRHTPFLSWWMRVLNCKFLNRGNPKEGLKTIQSAIADTKDGFSMFIEPEGTRNRGEGLLPFKQGSLKVAERTGCPIVPMAMIGTDEILEKHFPKIRAGHVTVIVGEPIATDGLSRDEKVALPNVVRERIKEMLLAHDFPFPAEEFADSAAENEPAPAAKAAAAKDAEAAAETPSVSR